MAPMKVATSVMAINPHDLRAVLARLIDAWESEVVEFKRGTENFLANQLGKYFSALANEANLRGAERAWLVLGVDDKTRKVVGTQYKNNSENLQADKLRVHDGTGGFTFREIHVLQHPNGRVIMFEIPAAPRGLPISWNGYWHGRAGDNLVALNHEKLDQIRSQSINNDWTAEIIDNARISDLDEHALSIARNRFATKHSNRFSQAEISSWDHDIFLDRSKLTFNGNITRAALLLLGKPEAAYFLNPHPAEITWTNVEKERVYEHFYPPFMITPSDIFNRIQNYNISLLPKNELIPHVIEKYDQRVILEALHNCIAHQDYHKNARILVKEHDEKIIFTSQGAFYDRTPEDYMLNRYTPNYYRNTFLVQAMTQLNMIDQMGYGISDIVKRQRNRYLPLPDYELSNSDEVSLTIYGSFVDQSYSQILMEMTDLPLEDVLALDRVQKNQKIQKNALSRLRRKNLIEGKMPNVFVSPTLVGAIKTETEIIQNGNGTDACYEKIIKDYLEHNDVADRSAIDELLADKLNQSLSEKQKNNKISYIIRKLKQNGVIYNTGTKKYPKWSLEK